MSTRQRLTAAAAVLAAAMLVFLLIPSPIEPLAWEPAAPPPLAGVLAPNRALTATEHLAAGAVEGPEDVAVDAAGRVYGGCIDGRIVRVTPGPGGGETVETFADTGGRPLGLHFDAAGRLIVADAVKGLLAIDPEGRIEVLATAARDSPFGFTDDLDVATDGRIYFSDASSRFGPDHYLYDLLEARPHGRLLRHDPATGLTEVLLDDLYFANGIALSASEDFVLVNETYRYRITRYWLEGEKAGTSDIFIDNLPGFPDGVSGNRRGTFWLALYTLRNPQADRLHRQPFLKRQLTKLPNFLWPQPETYGLVLALDENGSVRRSLHDPEGGTMANITSAEEAGGHLYFGTLYGSWIGRLKL